MKTLMYRALILFIQDRSFIIASFMRTIVVSLFYGTIFIGVGKGGDSSAYFNMLSVLFFSLTNNVMGMQTAVPAMINNRLVFYRERGAMAYGAFPYWISCWITMLPLIAGTSMVLTYCQLYLLCS